MKNMLIMLSTAALLTVGIGCKSEIDNKAAATVSESAEPSAAAEKSDEKGADAQDKGTSTASFDTSASKISWVGAKVTKDHDGGFKNFNGTVTYDAEGKISGVTTEIDATSVFADVEKLTNHLKEEDFFWVTKFPKATFTSNSIEPLKEGDGTHRVTGDLELRGVKKQLSFPVTIKQEGNTFVTTSEFTLKRFDWGVEYKGAADNLIKDEVLVKLHIVTPVPAES